MKEKAKEKTNSQNEARAVVRYLRISPRKVRPVINVIRKRPAVAALATLSALNKKAARLVEKALHSAVANAKVKGLQESRLLVWEAKADGGPLMKRFMSRSMGRADQILKRTTHLTITLQESGAPFGSSPAGEAGKVQKKKGDKKAGKAAAAAQ